LRSRIAAAIGQRWERSKSHFHRELCDSPRSLRHNLFCDAAESVGGVTSEQSAQLLRFLHGHFVNWLTFLAKFSEMRAFRAEPPFFVLTRKFRQIIVRASG
jgi:hypothetical protein